MVDKGFDKVAFTAKQIDSYLKMNPAAADSAKGIQRWWISRERYEASLEMVQLALDLLESQGLIIRTVIGSTAIYRRAPKWDGNKVE